MNKEEEAGKKATKIFGLALIILVFDQLSKFIIAKNIKNSIPIINNIFHITYVQNTGAGFGILKGQNILLIFIAIIVIGAILFYYDKLQGRIVHYSIGLILGGVLGNLIDRIRLGFVIDFLDFRIWPAFNIADSAVTIAVILLIIALWKPKKSFKA